MGYITPTTTSAEAVTESQLIDRVKARMDEIDHAASAVVDVGVIDNRPITTLIETLLNECKIDVLSNAPLTQLPKVKKVYEDGDDDIYPDAKIEAAEFIVPDDSVRIVSFKYESWTKPVTTLSLADSTPLKRQHYKYLRAKDNTPYVVIVDGSTLVAFPYLKAQGSSTFGDFEFVYVSELAEYSDFNNKMLNAICWDCAGKVFTAMGMIENANKCFENYNNIIK